MFRQFCAFIKKDFLLEKSYKVSFALGVLATFSGILVFYFTDKLFGRRLTPYLAEFGTGYFAYVFTAGAFFGYIGTGASSYSERLRVEQLQGTLEAQLSAPVSPAVFLISLSAWNFIFASFELLIYALAGLFVFRLDFSNANLPSVSVVFLLSSVSFAALGILSSCFVLLFKRGNPAAWVLNNFEGLLGGVYFPVAVLPAWLQWASKLLPVTYAVRAFELALHKGDGLYELRAELAVLFLFTAALAPVSVWAFGKALERARRRGTLGGY
ncbi:MAG: ABC transporter permease [Elusimicrobia bacterium]|nr:ABC transporter permease [Elusimicrobiota bacterium]